MGDDMTRWRKSTRSGTGGACVEIAHTLDQVRDSKNPGGPVLRVDLAQLISAIRQARLG